MSVKDRARQIVADADAKAAEVERARQAERREAALQRDERAAYVLEHSPLSEWFPDATFEIIDYTGVGTSLQYQSDGSDIIVRSDDGVLFGLHMQRQVYAEQPAKIKVFLVVFRQPYQYIPGISEPCYSGPKVKSAEDVARVLNAWDEL